jgi:hypothetical protein
VVDDEKLSFENRGVCGYGSTFDYTGWPNRLERAGVT